MLLHSRPTCYCNAVLIFGENSLSCWWHRMAFHKKRTDVSLIFFSGRVLSDTLALGGGWQNGSCHLALMLIGTVAPCALIDFFSCGWFEPRSGASWQNMAT